MSYSAGISPHGLLLVFGDLSRLEKAFFYLWYAWTVIKLITPTLSGPNQQETSSVFGRVERGNEASTLPDKDQSSGHASLYGILVILFKHTSSTQQIRPKVCQEDLKAVQYPGGSIHLAWARLARSNQWLLGDTGIFLLTRPLMYLFTLCIIQTLCHIVLTLVAVSNFSPGHSRDNRIHVNRRII